MYSPAQGRQEAPTVEFGVISRMDRRVSIRRSRQLNSVRDNKHSEAIMNHPTHPITTREAALLLCCREASIRTYIGTGRLAATKVGNRWLIMPTSVYALMPPGTAPTDHLASSHPAGGPNQIPSIP